MSPTYYYTNYQCQVCGRKASTSKKSIPTGQGDIPRCLVCRKALCLNCLKYGLCPEHYSHLSTETHEHIAVLKRQARNKTMYGVVVIIAGILILALLMGLGVYSQSVGGAVAGWGVMIVGIIITVCLAASGSAKIDLYVASQIQQGSQASSSSENDNFF